MTGHNCDKWVSVFLGGEGEKLVGWVRKESLFHTHEEFIWKCYSTPIKRVDLDFVWTVGHTKAAIAVAAHTN